MNVTTNLKTKNYTEGNANIVNVEKTSWYHKNGYNPQNKRRYEITCENRTKEKYNNKNVPTTNQCSEERLRKHFYGSNITSREKFEVEK